MKHLFIDDHEVEAIDNLARKLHQPAKFPGNAVVRPEHRWENCAIQIRTTPAWDPDDQRYKMIYWAVADSVAAEVRLTPTGDPAGCEEFYCYATSVDGVNWEKPSLGLCDYPVLRWGGVPIGRENNILPSAAGMLQGPVFDPHEQDPARRFKGMAYHDEALQPLVSADAVHWENPGLAPVASYDESHLTLDADRRLFIATVKHDGPYGRSFYLTTSPDFEHWSDQELVFHADQVDQENGCERLQRLLDNPAYRPLVYNRPEEWRTDVYNFPVFPYEGLYLALPVMHHWAGKRQPLFDNVDSRKSVEVASSRDLRHWQRVADRAVFIEHSPVGDGSAYDTGQIVTTNGPIRRNGELWFYYVGLRYRCLSLGDTLQRGYLDAGAVCLARLRLDGFVSLKGGSEWGSVLTRPVVVGAPELRANLDAWRGQVLAEVLDADDGHPLPGFTAEECLPARVDSVDAPLRWRAKADLRELLGRTVRLRFRVLRGELYAFWFAGGPVR